MKTPRKNSTEIRCGNCNKLLAIGAMQAGEIEILCSRCKTCNLLRAASPNLAPQDGLHGDRYARESIPPQS